MRPIKKSLPVDIRELREKFRKVALDVHHMGDYPLLLFSHGGPLPTRNDAYHYLPITVTDRYSMSSIHIIEGK